MIEVRTVVTFQGWGVDWKEPKVVFWGVGNILYIDLSVYYTGGTVLELNTEELMYK